MQITGRVKSMTNRGRNGEREKERERERLKPSGTPFPSSKDVGKKKKEPNQVYIPKNIKRSRLKQQILKMSIPIKVSNILEHWTSKYRILKTKI